MCTGHFAVNPMESPLAWVGRQRQRHLILSPGSLAGLFLWVVTTTVWEKKAPSNWTGLVSQGETGP